MPAFLVKATIEAVIYADNADKAQVEAEEQLGETCSEIHVYEVSPH